MKPFIAVFGSYNSTTSSYDLSASRESLITSVINIGELLGAVSSSFVGDRLGRKGGLYVSSTCVVIGTTLQVASTEIGALIAGRIVVGKILHSFSAVCGFSLLL